MFLTLLTVGTRADFSDGYAKSKPTPPEESSCLDRVA